MSLLESGLTFVDLPKLHDLLDALFNQWLLYEALNPDEQARNSWETYLTKDNDSRWAEEVKKKLEALRKKKIRGQNRTVRTPLQQPAVGLQQGERE